MTKTGGRHITQGNEDASRKQTRSTLAKGSHKISELDGRN